MGGGYERIKQVIMKTAEHYLMRWRDNEFELHELIELAQKEAYNQALEDAAEEVRDEILDWEDFHDFSAGVKTISNPEKRSILRLKK